MAPTAESFNLHQTIAAIGQALYDVICRTVFAAGLHGLIMAFVLVIIGVILSKRNIRFGKPLIVVSKRLSIICLCMMVPGLLALSGWGKPPHTGIANINSIGFISFWSLVCLYLFAEEANHSQKPPSRSDQ